MRNTYHPLRILLVVTAVLIFSIAGASAASACGPRPWRIVTSPNASSTSTNSLLAVTAISANNVWAVGYPTEHGVLIEHWNGSKWSILPDPSHGTTSDTLRGIAAVSAHDIWAVGDRYNPGKGVYQTLIEHWNGCKWVVVPSPNASAGKDRSSLSSVTAISQEDIWAVGNYLNSASNTAMTLIEHWNGQNWRIVANPNFGMGNDILWAVARVPGTYNAWAVGSHSGPTYQTLTESNG